jgi:hypothetical protein
MFSLINGYLSKHKYPFLENQTIYCSLCNGCPKKEDYYPGTVACKRCGFISALSAAKYERRIIK